MNDVPDDISIAARAVVERGYDEGLLEAVERALMAEREASAKIAGELLADAGHQTDLAPLVVAAIRRGTP